MIGAFGRGKLRRNLFKRIGYIRKGKCFSFPYDKTDFCFGLVVLKEKGYSEHSSILSGKCEHHKGKT
jgi:hypothetical protein